MPENPITEAIQRFFGDTSRSQEEALEGLLAAQDELQALIETLQAELDD